ncbi:vacuolar protein sorting-associated protein 30 [[Candida] railenensis]|uniref:Vacuolar protein sorting-associated protein 30 n=1 Tax=[Candida] railenensis TaxID=45579 RepID=A0A9P0QQH7_9ASCO|nr:vacuolar protein sorting-associated protein 30 [[Candida] railenensis]
MPINTLKCQKCNSPLHIDKSLLGLSHAQQNLLVGKIDYADKGKERLNPQDYIPPDRLKLYNEVISNSNSKNNNKKAMYDSLSDESDEEAKEEEHSAAQVKQESGFEDHGTGADDKSHLENSRSFVLLNSENDDSLSSSLERETTTDPSAVKQNNNSKETSPKRTAGYGRSNAEIHTFSQRTATLENIFKILSSNQDIDHPLCLECSDFLLVNYKLKFDKDQKEKENYLAFLRKLKSQENAFSTNDLEDNLKSTAKEFKQLQKVESKKLEELRSLEAEKLKLDIELNAVEREYDQLVSGQLNAVLQMKNQADFALSNKVNDLDKARASYQKSLDHLDELRGLNIYKKIFNITFDSQYGTINGFRLGYKVPWPENNAALGQIVLLLLYLLKRFNLKLQNYKLTPLGSQSHIVKITTPSDATGSTNGDPGAGVNSVYIEQKTKTILDLHTSNEFSLGKLFNFNKLDVSMIALLDIVSQIETKIVSIDSEIVLPYSISPKRDAIGGKSIRVTSNGEWTTSCKFLLINLNWLLSHSSVH